MKAQSDINEASLQTSLRAAGQVAAHPGSLADLPPQAGWSKIPVAEGAQWSLRLANEKNASIRQYPLFNERYRRTLTQPRYLRYADTHGDVLGFACIVIFGIPLLRCGVVIDGPVAIGERAPLGILVSALVDWFRSNGLAFVRLSHHDEEMAEHFARMPGAVSDNPFPFVPRYGRELVVRLTADDAEMLAGFQPIARRDIRKAAAAGCGLQKSADPEFFRSLWPIFASRAKQKGLRLGSLQDYESIFRLSPREDLVRLYTAYYGGKPVYSAVFLRDHSTAHYFIGALDKTALGSYPTPSCLLHWEAMRDYRNLGCTRYNLGGRSGSVYTFKKKFQPSEFPSPASTTLVFNPPLFRVWLRLVFPLLGGFKRGAALWQDSQKP
jgi:hypothetical protein